MKIINLYPSLGATLSLAWARDDIKGVAHVFNQTKPGEQIVPSDGAGGPHWPCKVCEKHGYTEDMFWAQIADALKRGPEKHL